MPAPCPEAPPVLCLAGPTASGKSALALALAQRQPSEIISVDSALVYRGMDIGTAKPSPSELASVPHHLINIRDPLHSYSAAEFVRDAQALIRAIRARGRRPLLAGGTMLYYKALFEGLDALPPADAATRLALSQQAQAQGWPALHAELARVDPATAARLAPADSQRIQRALEVWRLTGRPLSSFHSTRPAAGAPAGWQLVALEPHDRAWLHQRIAQRFDAMLAGGFVDEVRALQARGDLHPDLPAMRCVGYRQAWQALQHAANPAQLSALEWQTLRAQGIAATRQLAKRQLTWLRGMHWRHVLLIDERSHPQALADALERPHHAPA